MLDRLRQSGLKMTQAMKAAFGWLGFKLVPSCNLNMPQNFNGFFIIPSLVPNFESEFLRSVDKLQFR